MDAEIFSPPRNVVTLNTIAVPPSDREKGGSLTEAKKCHIKSERWRHRLTWLKSKSLSVKANKHRPLMAERLAFHALAI